MSQNTAGTATPLYWQCWQRAGTLLEVLSTIFPAYFTPRNFCGSSDFYPQPHLLDTGTSLKFSLALNLDVSTFQDFLTFLNHQIMEGDAQQEAQPAPNDSTNPSDSSQVRISSQFLLKREVFCYLEITFTLSKIKFIMIMHKHTMIHV